MQAPPDRRPAWRVIKTYGHDEGLSCAFRQWQAWHSHCRFVHGYALAFSFIFASDNLDDRGWCIDFGGLKALRAWLHEMFDHTLLVAADDPERERLEALAGFGVARIHVLDMVGCESFALLAHRWISAFLHVETGGRVVCERVEVSEHPGNTASFTLAKG